MKTDITVVYVSPELNKGLELVNNGDYERAFHYFQSYSEREPSNPIVKSFLGYLTAIHQKRPLQGLEMCLEAIKLEREEPLIYLNLAKIYMLMKDRYHAVQAIHAGLKYTHSPFRNELMNFYKQIGIRRRPPITFLSRNHPLNVFLGKLLRRKK